MKHPLQHKLLLGATVLLVLFSLNGCEEDVPTMTANPTSLSFTQAGGTATVNLATNSMSWSASTTGSGFSVSPSSGAGNATLTVTAKESTSSDDRTGTLTIKSGSLQATVSLTQGAKSTLQATGDNKIDAAGGAYAVTLKYNTAYTVEVDASAQSWIQYTGTKALQTATLQFTIAANEGAPRTGNITIKDNTGVAQPVTLTLTQGEKPIRTSLMAFYDALDGANWVSNKKTNWGSNEPVTSWGGLTFQEGRLTELHLDAFGLAGELPASMADFPDLVVISANDNPKLTGAIPDALWACTGMTNFSLDNTQISGVLSDGIGAWNQLQTLSLCNTQLASPLPDTLFTASHELRELRLANNAKLTGQLPEALSRVATSQETLSVQLQNCNFTGGIPASWGNLPENVTVLYVSDNRLTDPVPLSIQAHPRWLDGKWDLTLKGTHMMRTQQNDVYLELEEVPNAQRDMLMKLYEALGGDQWASSKKKNWASDEDIATWGGVTVVNDAIVALNLNGFGLKGEMPASISDFTLLERLNIGSNPKLTGAIPEEVGQLVNLTTFLADTTGLNKALPASMGALTKLTKLVIGNNSIPGTIPAEWSGMTALTHFQMTGTQMTMPIPETLFTSWKHLSVWNLSNNSKMTGSLPAALGNLTTDAKSLSIQWQQCNFTGGVPAEWGQLPAVCDQLYIYNNKLTEDLPDAFLKHPSWTTGKWDSVVSGTKTHGIRTQQNNVYLELAATLPVVSEVTVVDVTYNSITVKATIEGDGHAEITSRGFQLGASSRRVSGTTGEYTYTFKDLNSSSPYTIRAFATNRIGTAYSQEITVTTKIYSALSLQVYNSEQISLEGAKVALSGPQEYTQYVTEEGAALFENIVPGVYYVSVDRASYLPFHAMITVQEGVTTQTIENVPSLSYSTPFVRLYKENTRLRPFASQVVNDAVMGTVVIPTETMASYKSKELKDLVYFPVDTTSFVFIVAHSLEELAETYETMQEIIGEDGSIDPESVSTETMISFLTVHAQRIISVPGKDLIPGQTNTLSYEKYCMKNSMLNAMTPEQKAQISAFLPGFADAPKFIIEEGKGLIINMIAQQASAKGVLMTDGDGPVVEGGNLVTIGSNKDITQLSQLGYQGNWHLGALLK